MSVVVAIKENKKVYIGADSQVTRGGTRRTLRNPNNYKVWKIKGVENCLMAHVGNLREANVVRLMDGLVSEYNIYKNHIDFEFIVKKIVPEIFDELKNYGFLKDNKYIESIDSRFLFAYKDQLYLINSDGCVLEIDDFVAIGSGEGEAIGSLLSTDNQDPTQRIIKAIKSSAVADIYVDYPIILTNTEETNFDIITEQNEQHYLNKEKI